MKFIRTAYLLILIGVISSGYAATGATPTAPLQDAHRYTTNQCGTCHVDTDKNVNSLKPVSNSLCTGCHADILQYQSHPVDIFAVIPIPADLPLVDGRLGCITCHFAHPLPQASKNFRPYQLRKPGKGAAFCTSCHRFDKNEHRFLESAHGISNWYGFQSSSLDVYTLQCVECHDRYLNIGSDRDPIGKHFFSNRRFNHPIGVSLDRAAAGNPRKFNRGSTLAGEIRLFNGKVGCGTCHNSFSKEKGMLVMNNYRSRLCLECHIK